MNALPSAPHGVIRSPEPGQIKGLILDLDGTLCDTQAVHQAAWEESAQQFGVQLTADFLEYQKGRTNENAALHLLGESRYAEIGPALVEAKKATVLAQAHRGYWYPDFLTFHGRLKAHGFPVAICTSSQRAFVERMLEMHEELGDLAAGIVAREAYHHSKPHPEPLWIACQRLGLPAADCVYIGDAGVDAEASANAGATFLYYCPQDTEPDEAVMRRGATRIRSHGEVERYLSLPAKQGGLAGRAE